MNDALWSALHEALDARRDPLSDPRVEGLLAQQPESLPQVLDLLDRLTSLPPARSQPTRPARSRRVAAAAGLVLALGLAWSARGLIPAEAAPVHVPTGQVSPGLAPPGQVLSWRVTITHDAPGGTSRTRCEDGRVTFDARTHLDGPDAIARVTTHTDL